MTQRLVATVYGFVQGVNFRVSVKKEADKIGLTGYVKNMPNGTVKVVAEGERSRLDILLKFLKRGPIFAKVERVDYDFEHGKPKFSRFTVKRQGSLFHDQICAYNNFLKNFFR